MNFNGEDLTRLINMEAIVRNIYQDTEHGLRVKSVARAALGLVASASLIVHRIGRGMASLFGLEDKHAIKQVDRLLSNNKLKPNRFFGFWVPHIIASRKEVKIAMDWTDFSADNQAVIQLSVITSHGRATPLIWKTVDKSTLKYNQINYESEVLETLRQHIPKEVEVTIIADRGFGDVDRYRYIKEELKFDYIIRFRADIYVTNDKGEKKLSGDWVPKDGKIKTIKNAKVTNENYLVSTVVCHKDKGMKQSWCIASSLESLSGSGIVKWYSKRWSIEPQFRDTKDLHFGMGLSETRIKNVERRDRLLIIHALSTMVLTLLGAAGEKLGYDRLLKANTVKKRTMSLFRQGCTYFTKLATYKKEKSEALLECFNELLLGHAKMTSVLLEI